MAITPEEAKRELERRAALKAVQTERQSLQSQIAELENKASGYETVGTIASSIGQGLLPFGGSFTDELASLIQAPFSDRTYSEIQAEKERQLAAGREAAPVSALAAEVIPGLMTGSTLNKALTKAPGTIAKIGEYLLGPTGKTTTKLPQLLTSQTLQGAAYGAGAAEQGEGIEGALLGGATGLGTAAGLRLAGNLVRGTAEKLKKTGQRIQRTSLGVRPSDYAKTGTRSGTIEIDMPIDETGDVTVSQLVTKTKQAVDDVIASKELPKTRDPGQLSAFVSNKLEDISTKTADVIRRKDEELAANRTLVKFVNTDKTKKLIKTGRYSTDEQNEIINAIEDIKKQFDEISPGEELTLLQQAKQGLTSKYKETSDKMAAAYRQLYNDFKTHIESYVPEVKELNKQNQKWQYVQKPIFRELVKSEGFNDIEEMRRLLYTTGGIAAPMLLGAGLGAAGSEGDAAGGALRGALVGGTLKYASQPEQAARIGRTLESISKLAGSSQTKAAASQLAQALTRTTVRNATIPESNTASASLAQAMEPEIKPAAKITREEAIAELKRRELLQSTKSTNLKIVKPDQIKQLINSQSSVIKAIIATESAGKPDAVSKKGAVGLMQLMPATAKELGVDPYDPAQNVEGGSRYFNQLLERFNDRDLALAAYNWGPTNLSKAIKKLDKLGIKPTWKNMLDNLDIPKETRQYVGKVKSNLANKFKIKI